MNLIECVTSINDHIINLNCIFYYVFQQNIHDFHEFQGGGWVDVCIGWVFKMMCMRSGRGMWCGECGEGREMRCGECDEGNALRGGNVMSGIRWGECEGNVLRGMWWGEFGDGNTMRWGECGVGRGMWWGECDEGKHATRPGEGIAATKTHKTRPHGQNCHSKSSKQHMKKKIKKIIHTQWKEPKKAHTRQSKFI